MGYDKKELKKGITLHTIDTDKFKTNLIAIFLTTELNRENVTKNAVISSILRRGSKNLPSQEEISKKMEEMYGASFDCGLDKTGDNQVLKFYVETVNDKFLPQNNENILKTALESIFDIVFNPYIEENSFKKEYVEQEKNNIKHLIESKIDNKARYARERCIEEMYKNKPFGLYGYGYIEDLEKIDGKNIYEYYKELINTCKIDIFVSGSIDNTIINLINDNENIKKMQERNAKYIIPDTLNKEVAEKENNVTESMEVTQGKLVLGLDLNLDKKEARYSVLLYNSILGGSANSKMFQNVREKANLAYAVSSSYLRYKSNIFVNCGIEIKNYEQALELIRKQIDDMKAGEFTDEDIENAKKGIIASIKTIDNEQDTEITYYFGQELSTESTSIDEYIDNINKVNKADIIDIANRTTINTIYFLKD